MSPRRSGAVMYLVAAVAFLVAGTAGVFGESGLAVPGFLILGAAFLVLALNTWPRRDETKVTGSRSG